MPKGKSKSKKGRAPVGTHSTGPEERSVEMVLAEAFSFQYEIGRPGGWKGAGTSVSELYLRGKEAAANWMILRSAGGAKFIPSSFVAPGDDHFVRPSDAELDSLFGMALPTDLLRNWKPLPIHVMHVETDAIPLCLVYVQTFSIKGRSESREEEGVYLVGYVFLNSEETGIIRVPTEIRVRMKGPFKKDEVAELRSDSGDKVPLFSGVYVVAGGAASGKSVLAAALSDKLDAPLLIADEPDVGMPFYSIDILPAFMRSDSLVSIVDSVRTWAVLGVKNDSYMAGGVPRSIISTLFTLDQYATEVSKALIIVLNPQSLRALEEVIEAIKGSVTGLITIQKVNSEARIVTAVLTTRPERKAVAVTLPWSDKTRSSSTDGEGEASGPLTSLNLTSDIAPLLVDQSDSSSEVLLAETKPFVAKTVIDMPESAGSGFWFSTSDDEEE